MSWRTVWQRIFTWFEQWFGMQYFAMDGAGSQGPPIAEPERLSHPAPPTRTHTRVVASVRLPGKWEPPPCEVCGESATPIRTHDGHWRCSAHKGVTCDVCGRAVPAETLPDQSWRCRVH